MDVMDYLIDTEDKDWEELLSAWRFLLPKTFNVWLVNRVGDVFAVFEDGSVHMLDVGRGTLERVADNCDQFVTRIDQDDHANTWMMVSLVNACVKAGRISVMGSRFLPCWAVVMKSTTWSRRICRCIIRCWARFASRRRICRGGRR